MESVCACVCWVCAALSVVGLGALSCVCVRVLGLDNSLCAQLPLSNSMYSRLLMIEPMVSLRFMDFGWAIYDGTVSPVVVVGHFESKPNIDIWDGQAFFTCMMVFRSVVMHSNAITSCTCHWGQAGKPVVNDPL